MNYLILGKQSFVSKKGTQCNILHVGYQDNNVSGMAVKTEFVSDEVFGSVETRKTYAVVYGAYSNGRAYISELKEVSGYDG